MKKTFSFRFIKLMFGLFLFALGAVMTIQAHIGYAPWDVFHVGLAHRLGISIGQANIITGIVIVLIGFMVKERFGIGSLLNMISVGIFMDLIMSTGLIHQCVNFRSGLVLHLAGIVVIAFGSYFYISPGFGSGPRDGLMVAMARQGKLSIGACRIILELSATALGYFLGGMVGIGTVLFVVLVGPAIQVVFHLFKFMPHHVQQEDIKETLSYLLRK